MSLEIELHVVPHLKGLINASYISGQQQNFWDPLISAIFHIRKFLIINVNFLLAAILVGKMKEFLLDKFVSNDKESTTFRKNTGPDFGCSCWICY